MSDDLLKRILEGRRKWVDLGNGAEVHLQRPAEVDLVGGLRPDAIVSAVIDWRGMTLGDILGSAASEAERGQAVPFSPDLAAEVLRDNAEWLTKAAEALAELIQGHLKARESVSGN